MKKKIVILLAGAVLLLCSCKDQSMVGFTTSKTTADTTVEETMEETLALETSEEQEASETETDTSESSQTADSSAPETEPTGSRRKTATKPPRIDESQFQYEGPPEKRSYEDVVSRAVGKVIEEEGTYGGSPVVWSTISDQDFVYFFYRFTGKAESEEQELADYVIIGEEVELSSGIHTGMSVEEVEDLLPGLYHFRWDEETEESWYRWNTGTYPEGYAEQFPTILIAEVDNGKKTPLYVGFMADETGVIRAIAFCNPTAG